MYVFGRTSMKRLATTRPEVRNILIEAIQTSEIDFGVVCGWRGEEEQNAAYIQGKSNAKYGQSDHNMMIGDKPYSPAIDIAPYSHELRDYIWFDDALWKYLHAHIIATAERLGFKMLCGVILKNGLVDNPHCLLVY